MLTDGTRARLSIVGASGCHATDEDRARIDLTQVTKDTGALAEALIRLDERVRYFEEFIQRRIDAS